jgi:hypothetical protein
MVPTRHGSHLVAPTDPKPLELTTEAVDQSNRRLQKAQQMYRQAQLDAIDARLKCIRQSGFLSQLQWHVESRYIDGLAIQATLEPDFRIPKGLTALVSSFKITQKASLELDDESVLLTIDGTPEEVIDQLKKLEIKNLDLTNFTREVDRTRTRLQQDEALLWQLCDYTGLTR